ncbi:pentapeptide repeat-containing protein [Streptomyces sp. NPDC001941]|uniref:pentapeptide repeat-containing protein n=1 Tax=Streptomyces sp. NPDC001941 TaxID=3154659 RepID=UPI00331FBFC2
MAIGPLPEDESDQTHPEEPAGDVQAALTALTRAESRTHVDQREPLDLSGLHLAGANLRDVDLTAAYLVGATLMDAYLVGATLTRGYLVGATLMDAYLVGATLTGAYLRGATLTRANLEDATLAGANLLGATLTRANLEDATLTGAFGVSVGQILAARTDEETVLPGWLYPLVGPAMARE